jgi:hypothetical protein
MKLLSLFIRYVVACQLDDRTGVPMNDSKTGHPFFVVMTDAIKEANGQLSLPEIGEAARATWPSRGCFLPWEASVLEGIEKIAFDGEPTATKRRRGGPYEVHTGDLDVLIFVIATCKTWDVRSLLIWTCAASSSHTPEAVRMRRKTWQSLASCDGHLY